MRTVSGGPPGEEPSEELRVACPVDRRGAESLFLELRERARQMGFDLELVSVELSGRIDTPSQPDA